MEKPLIYLLKVIKFLPIIISKPQIDYSAPVWVSKADVAALEMFFGRRRWLKIGDATAKSFISWNMAYEKLLEFSIFSMKMQKWFLKDQKKRLSENNIVNENTSLIFCHEIDLPIKTHWEGKLDIKLSKSIFSNKMCPIMDQ